VDDIDLDATDNEIEFDEITVWAPALGVTLGPGDTSILSYTVDTASGFFASGVNFIGIYAMGWNYTPDE
jgi:hypothetical protein